MKHHFFDIGANIGQTFDDFLTKTTAFDGWDVWCFEPSPRVSEIYVEFHSIKEGGNQLEMQNLSFAYLAAGKPLKQWMY